MNSKEINQVIVNRIIEQIEKGVNPWVKGWKHPNLLTNKIFNKDFAYNYITNNMYQGINQVMLEPGYYMTFNQIKDNGARIKKGAKSSVVFFTKTSVIYADDETSKHLNQLNIDDNNYVFDELLTYWQKDKSGKWYTIKSMLKDYRVFNIKDLENLKPIKNRFDFDNPDSNEPKENEPIFTDHEEAENIIKDYVKRGKLHFQHLAIDSAFYSSSAHSVTLPYKSQFNSMGEYYGTAFHELAHSTGHRSLLNRDTLVNNDGFGGHTYSKEELVAEITSTFITSYLNINTRDLFTNSASYLKGWAEVLKDELSNSIMSAFNKAQKAFELILNISSDGEEIPHC